MGKEQVKETPKIMSTPLPTILDEIEDNITELRGLVLRAEKAEEGAIAAAKEAGEIAKVASAEAIEGAREAAKVIARVAESKAEGADFKADMAQKAIDVLTLVVNSLKDKVAIVDADLTKLIQASLNSRLEFYENFTKTAPRVKKVP